MSKSCINFNSPELKASIQTLAEYSVSNPIFEVTRDYLQYGKFRDPSDIINKLGIDIIESRGRVIQKQSKSTDDLINIDPESNVREIQDFLYPGLREELDSKYKIGSIVGNDNIDANILVKGLLNRISDQLTIRYNFFTASQVQELLGDRYAGQTMFFHNGEVYFVGDKISTLNVFHEFSHPLVKAIAQTNPRLFNNLYIAASKMSTSTLKEDGTYETFEESVARKRKDLDPNSQQFKEEVIVEVISRSADATFTGLKENTGFLGLVKEIFYLIKQQLRKLFGRKIDISKLNANTSLSKLSKILAEGGQFDIDLNTVTSQDIDEMRAEEIQYAKELKERVAPKILASISHEVFSMMSSNLNMLKKNYNYREIHDLLKDASGKSYIKSITQLVGKYTKKVSPEDLELYAMLDENRDLLLSEIEELHDETDEAKRLKGILRYLKEKNRISIEEFKNLLGDIMAFNTDINTKLKSFENDINFEKNRAEALIETIVIMQTVSKEMSEQLRKYAEKPTRDTVRKAHSYNNILVYWQERFDAIKKDFQEQGVHGPVLNELNNVLDTITTAKEQTKKIYKSGALDIVMIEAIKWQESIDEIYRKKIEVHKNQDAWIIRQDKNAYEKASIIPWNLFLDPNQSIEDAAKEKGLSVEAFKKQVLRESIGKYMDGELGDAHALNSFFEGYMYNQDPIIGGFASYIKDNMTDVIASTTIKFEKFAADILPALNDINYNPINIDKLGQQTTFSDTVAYFDEKTKTFVPKKIYAFLQPNKDWRYALKMKQEELNKAKRDIDSASKDEREDMQSIYDELNNKFNKWKTKYFYQPFVSEYYKLEEKYFDTEIGKKAKKREEEILKDIEIYRNSNTEDDEAILSDLWIKYNNMNDPKRPDGTDKTGEEKEIADLLTRYREERSEYMERAPRKNAFEKNYLRNKDINISIVKEELRRDGIRSSMPEYKAQLQSRVSQAMILWLRENSRVQIKPSFWDRQKQIFKEISELTIVIAQTDEYNEEKESLTNEKRELLKRKKDTSLQWDINKLDNSTIIRLAEIEDALYNLDFNKKITGGGLTKAEMKERNEYITFNILVSEEVEGTLSEEGEEELKKLTTKFGYTLSSKNIARLEELDIKAEASGNPLDEETKDRISALWQEYHSMSTVEPSSHYYDTFDRSVMAIEDKNIIAEFWGLVGSKRKILYDVLDIDDLYKDISTGPLSILMKDPGFSKWFEANHKTKEVFNYSILQYEEVTQRRDIWNYKIPVDKEYVEEYTGSLKSEDVELNGISRIPTSKYFTYRVKDKYRTERTIGKTTNNLDRWLPKNLEDIQAYRAQHPEDFSAEEPWDAFINHEYYRIQKEDPKLFAVIEKLTDQLLKTQKGMGKKGRVYLDVPRYYKSGWEILKGTKGIKNNPISLLIQRIRNYVLSNRQTFLDGGNFQDEVNLVNLDMFDDEVSGIQVSGSHFMEQELVSLDVINSLMKYMMSAERQKKLIEIMPIANAFRESLTDVKGHPKGITDPGKVDMKSYFRQLLDPKSPLRFLKKKSGNVRLDTINNIIAREFEGKTQAGFSKNMGGLNKFSQVIFGRASFGFFALNIPSATKNNLTQQFQAMLHAVGSADYNFKDLAFGYGWAVKTSTMISFNIYNKGNIPLELQMIEAMDPSQGRTEMRHGDRLSRTLVKDMVSTGVLYNTRQWLQLQAQLTIYGAAMRAKKIDMNGQEISYLDAWEQVSDPSGAKLLSLKPGIDLRYSNQATKHVYKTGETLEDIAKQYNISLEKLIENSGYDDVLTIKEGTELIVINNDLFKNFVRRQHDIQNKLNGAYAPWEQPEANRFLLFKLVSYLRKYFTRMFLYRFQMRGNIFNPVERFNANYGDAEMGWYIEAMHAIIRIIGTKGKYLNALSKKEKAAMLRVLLEMIGLLMLGWIIPMMLGWDPDDDEKYDKLRERSGSMSGPFMPGDDYEWNPFGFLANHALLMSMQVRQEAETFVPLPGYGLDDYLNIMNLSSIAYGPTIEAYVKMAGSVAKAASNDDSAYYKRDTGPYVWQKEGGFKGMKYFAAAFGITGSSTDPITAVRNFQGFRSR